MSGIITYISPLKVAILHLMYVNNLYMKHLGKLSFKPLESWLEAEFNGHASKKLAKWVSYPQRDPIIASDGKCIP